MKATEPNAKRTIAPDEKIDVRSGKCTYGQMNDLGRILDAANVARDNGTFDEVETTLSLIKVLHKDVDPAFSLPNVRYALEVAESVRFWRELESAKLKYEPSAEEKAAGYEALAKATGPTGVASTIAEKFGVEGGPDAVFEWPYASVFMVLYIDLERYKYQKRLSDIREAKRKRKEQSARLSRKK